MGACRGLDVTMALSTGLALGGCWPPLAIAGPAVLALYITGLTYIARDEVDGNTTRRARTGLVVIAAVALAALAGLAVAAGLPQPAGLAVGGAGARPGVAQLGAGVAPPRRPVDRPRDRRRHHAGAGD